MDDVYFKFIHKYLSLENIKICRIGLVWNNGQYIFKPNYGEGGMAGHGSTIVGQAKCNLTTKYTSLK